MDNHALFELVEIDNELTIQELADLMETSWSSIQRHLKQIGKTLREGRWVPHKLSNSNKEQRYAIATKLLVRHENEPFLKRIVTSNEKWMRCDNPKRRKQWLSMGQKPNPKLKPNLHMKKQMLCI